MTYPTKKLREVLELNYGKGVSKDERDPNGKYPVYGANGVLGYANKFLIDQEAVIVGRKGSAGKVTRVSGKFWPSDVTYFVLGNDQIDIDYVFHLLKSLKLQRFAVGVKPGINRNRVYDIEIPLPPLAEQKKIVARLEKLLAKVNEAKKLRAEAQEAASQLLPAELNKIFEEGKKKYEPENLGNVAGLVRGPFGGSLRKDMFVDEGYAVYEQGNVIKDNTASFRYFISDKKFDEMRRFEVNSGDILMSCSGTIGKFTIIPAKFKEGIINQALLKITPGKNIDVDYLRYALDDYLKQSTTHIKGGAIKNITSVKELKKFEIPFPPLLEQKKIVVQLDSISEKAKQLQEYQKTTSNDLFSLEQSILHKAFEGKLL